MTRKRRISSLIGMMRVRNSILMGIAVVASEWVALKAPAGLMEEIAGFLVAFFLTAGVMITNDYFDREVDMINRPERPIPSGAVTGKQAIAFSASLFVVGIASSAIGPWMPIALPLALFSVVISLAYNAGLKKKGIAGNAIVSFNVALPFIYGSIMVGRPESLMNDLFFVYAFVANMAREIFKGIPDVAGDKSRGVRTLAVVYGAETAGLVGFVLVALDVACSPLPYFLGVAGIGYMIPLIVGDLLLLHSSFVMAKRPEPRVVDKEKGEMLLGMGIIILAFLLSPLRLKC
ncbi:UbiA family prenyltransferase [Tardisphaera miroshnichenkoae]